ncbi:biotin-dependent carboxyltransferase family protein [Clostridium magnum]|uniref:KipI antagonist n=1 Tax=Clostridium magnum DSM 2767 TaxID=1121326 RepID=A0A162SMT9_9CLOT|nr:biotin-dependent carboxyltransferase family protein [Clostridium magnum]KZL91631.1 KipI antagonist [Clostridium magnum DSM 2767]SHH50234.1 antagonist of KipI [Clostridium magnum DSM 2767]
MGITVINPGLLTTIQDLGRYGYQKYGIIVSGAMDTYSLRLANLLVGNKEGEAALEITLMGPSLEIEKGTLLAITGGDLSPTINGESIPMWRPVYLHEKSILKFGACKSGCRSYLAVAGGYDVAEVMESKSTYLRAGIGGFQGRGLQKDDVLEFKSPREESLNIIENLSKKHSANFFSSTLWYLRKKSVIKDSQNIKIRVIRNRQFDQFSLDSKKQFLTCSFKISHQSDRMGYRLQGPAINLEKPLEMISEAVALGTIQVPPDGNPIILLADRQTVGGYPKIAQIATVDISKVVQSKPGDRISFEEISLEEAERLYIEREKYIQNLKIAITLRKC